MFTYSPDVYSINSRAIAKTEDIIDQNMVVNILLTCNSQYVKSLWVVDEFAYWVTEEFAYSLVKEFAYSLVVEFAYSLVEEFAYSPVEEFAYCVVEEFVSS